MLLGALQVKMWFKGLGELDRLTMKAVDIPKTDKVICELMDAQLLTLVVEQRQLIDLMLLV